MLHTFLQWTDWSAKKTKSTIWHKSRTYLNNTCIAQILQRHQVFCLADAVQVASTESECGEILVYRCEQLLSSCDAQWYVANIIILHVVATLQVFTNKTFAWKKINFKSHLLEVLNSTTHA
jgi:hypothetical protein